MRYIVIGAGAVGGSIGAALFAAGRDVVLVARGAHHDAIAAGGLTFRTPRGTEHLHIPVVAGPDELTLTPDDVLVLGVKVQDSIAALETWGPVPVNGGGTADTDLPLFCAQNGVEGERIALRRFARVYGVTVMLPATYLAPGEIAAVGDPLIGVLTVGRYPNGSDLLVDAVCADLEAAGIGGRPTEAVMRWKYTKLLANLGNAVEAITGPVESGAATDLVSRARAEGLAVLAAAGIDHAGPDEDAGARTRLITREIPGQPRGGGSTWQSLTRGTGRVEADYLAGEVVLLGRLHAVPTPVNATLCRVADDFARRGVRPGSMTVPELLALIE
ncbi:ketopantoate reductase family protein [Nakamurella sp. PAMC28650]|uniref:ketopantoate reductase family protein n=1 Tax=Nakamurella sp. PAMC28650 TaxID=2762325 RepID=UPI00164DBB71|nr:ketopantoate reductase family protein [Nakamurella sp. PAMC28650]QNK80579.1 ketopantoate reductase family protein [Nakamurella sp. PAMC28650]